MLCRISRRRGGWFWVTLVACFGEEIVRFVDEDAGSDVLEMFVWLKSKREVVEGRGSGSKRDVFLSSWPFRMMSSRLSRFPLSI